MMNNNGFLLESVSEIKKLSYSCYQMGELC